MIRLAPAALVAWAICATAVAGHARPAPPSRPPVDRAAANLREVDRGLREVHALLRAARRTLPRDRLRAEAERELREMRRDYEAMAADWTRIQRLGLAPLLDASILPRLGPPFHPRDRRATRATRSFSVNAPRMPAFERLARRDERAQTFAGFDVTIDLHGLGSHGALSTGLVRAGAGRAIRGLLKRHSSEPAIVDELVRDGMALEEVHPETATEPAPTRVLKLGARTFTLARGAWRRVNVHDAGPPRADIAAMVAGGLEGVARLHRGGQGAVPRARTALPGRRARARRLPPRGPPSRRQGDLRAARRAGPQLRQRRPDPAALHPADARPGPARRPPRHRAGRRAARALLRRRGRPAPPRAQRQPRPPARGGIAAETALLT